MVINRINSSEIVNSNYTMTSKKNEKDESFSTQLTAASVSNNVEIISNIAREYDVTNMTPREVSDMSKKLYENGSISFKQHALLSFQPDLDPNYNDTIGKRTNTIAQPDTPKNFLEKWRDKLEEQIKNGTPHDIIENTKEIVSILENLNVRRENIRL